MNAQQRAPVSQRNVAIGSPESKSHTLSVLSKDAETARFPSCATATSLTESQWPSNVRSTRPVCRSHTFSVLSAEAETTCFPSGVTATPKTQ